MDKYLIIKLLKHDKYKRYVVQFIERITNIRKRNIYKVINDIPKANIQSDKVSLQKLLRYTEPKLPNDGSYRLSRRWKFIKPFVKNVNKYMDFGGNDGKLASYIATKLSLKPEDAICADISNWMEFNERATTTSNYTFLQLSSESHKIKLKSNSLDLITAFQVLHHIPYMEKSLIELIRILKPNGILIIREHNYENNKQLKRLIDLEHLLWYFQEKHSEKDYYEKYCDEYFGLYRSFTYFYKIASQYGMKLIKFQDLKTNTKYYYSVYKKIR